MPAKKIPGWERLPSDGGPTVWRHKASGWEVRCTNPKATSPWEVFPAGVPFPLNGPYAFFPEAIAAVERRLHLVANTAEPLL